MKNQVKKSVLNPIVRFYKYLFEKPYEYSDDESKIVVLLNKALNADSTKIIMSPLSANYFLLKDPGNVKMVLNGKTLKVALPGNNYFKDLSEKFANILISSVIDKIEENRAAIFKSILDSELDLLDEIIAKFEDQEPLAIIPKAEKKDEKVLITN